MKGTMLILLVMVCMGCASSSKTYAPNGRPAYSINCSGTLRNWGMCYEKAGDICKGRGFIVIQSNSDKGYIYSGSQLGYSGGSIINRTMYIQCR